MLTTLVLQSSSLQTGLCVPTETVQSFASTVGFEDNFICRISFLVCSSVDLCKTYDWMSSKSSFLISCTIFFLPVHHRNEYLSQILHFSMAKGDLGYKQNLGTLPKDSLKHGILQVFFHQDIRSLSCMNLFRGWKKISMSQKFSIK